MKKKLNFLLLLMGIIIVLLVGCKQIPPQTPEDTKPIQQEEEEIKEEVTKEEPLQEESLPTILSFWTLWSEESKEQLDILENVYKLLREDVVIIGVHATIFETLSKEEIQSYIDDKKYSFPILLDEEGEKSQLYFIGTIPTTVFLDEKQEVTKSFTTKIEEDTILQEIQEILQNTKYPQ